MPHVMPKEPIRSLTALNTGEAFPVASEQALAVEINGRPARTLVCTPTHPEELVTGWLVTEGLAASAGDIRQVALTEDGARALVTLADPLPAPREPAPVTPIPWEPAWLLSLAERLHGRGAAGEESQPLYGATHAVHACFLAEGGRLLCVREDLGRHNALDKAVGWAVRAGIDLRRCVMFTTGRLPSDMVTKAIRAGVPVLASKTFPTAEGAALARAANLTLVTVRGGRLLRWSGPEGGV